jgi:hypothetical protein
VIGQEVADARAAEAEHRERHGDPVSPLQGATYQGERGEYDLLRFVESDTDTTIAAFTRRFEEGSDGQRKQLRVMMTDRDFYTLICFARRFAVVTLRANDFEAARLAMVALAVIDSARVDPRDILWAAAIARHAMHRVNQTAEAARSITAAAKLAEPGTAKLLRRFRTADDHDLQTDWKMMDVRTSGFIGFVEIGDRKNTGSLDLLGASLRLMDVVSRDKYLADGPTVGDDISPNWFPRNCGPEIESLLRRSPGIVSFHADLRPEHQRPEATPFDHLFLAFVIEMATTADSGRFENLWREAARTFATLVVRHDRMVLLVIAQSSVEGLAPVESDQTLERFDAPSRQILNESATE